MTCTFSLAKEMNPVSRVLFVVIISIIFVTVIIGKKLKLI